MDIMTMVGEFLSSDHGEQAKNALAAHGVTGTEATSVLTHAATAAGEHTEDHATGSGLLGAHPGKSFFAAFAAGLVRGDGLLGALEDGAQGVIAAKVSEAITARAGVDGAVSSTLAAAATPFILDFLKSHLHSKSR